MLTMLSIYLFTRFFKKNPNEASLSQDGGVAEVGHNAERGYWPVILPSVAK